MSELRVRPHSMLPSGQCYDRYEADKVFAALEERHKMEVEQLLMEIAELKEKRDTAEKLLNKALDCVSNGKNHIISLARKNNHSNYKRCLAMAKWCERKRIDAANYRIPRQKWDFYDKWHRRWLELAEQFKEAK